MCRLFRIDSFQETRSTLLSGSKFAPSLTLFYIFVLSGRRKILFPWVRALCDQPKTFRMPCKDLFAHPEPRSPANPTHIIELETQNNKFRTIKKINDYPQ